MNKPVDRKCHVNDGGKIACPVFSSPRKVYGKDDISIKKRSSDPALGIGRNPSPEKATEDAIEKIGGMCKYVKAGDLVGIKINITGGISTNPASYTSPEVAKKVVTMVRKCGGNPVAFDSSMIWTDMKPIAEKERWYEWAKENDIEVVDLHNLPVVPFNFGSDSVINVDKASSLVKDLDVLISIPKMKTHMLTTVTLGLKNNYGLLPRADKGVYHAKDIDTVIAEVNRAFPTTLTVVDGMIAGEGEAGPLTPDPIPDYNTVIASNDIVCADAATAKLMGFENPMKIRHVRISSMLGVGDGTCTDRPAIKKEIDTVTREHGHPKDGKFEKPDPRVIENLADFTKTIAASPGGASFMSNFADMFLGNVSYYTTGLIRNTLKGVIRLQRRYIGKDRVDVNIHGLNLHDEDRTDSYLY